jgi:hypothetical protein
MAKRTVRYAPEFKRQMVDLLRSGRVNFRHIGATGFSAYRSQVTFGI